MTTPATPSTSNATSSTPAPHIRIVPHLDAPRSLHFDVVDKDVPEGFVLKIGRFTDKQALPNRVTFKSKVVSRGHAEIFTEHGKFFIRDTKSSSGTFLNHARLSPPGIESKPTLLKDGDVIQLGVDYQGGTQEIYRCVKMRLELNRSWQQQANAFSTNTLKTIRSLTTADPASCTDCCICLFRIASFQSLFVAPCSHVYHYKCIRPMLMSHHPGFLCPLCRTFADLEATVEIDDPVEEQAAVQSTAQVESPVSNAQEPIEQICDAESTVPPPTSSSTSSAIEIDPVVRPAVEEASLPTPTSVQAHTFLPQEQQDISGLGPIELDPPAPTTDDDATSSPRPSGGPTPSSSTSSLSAQQQPSQASTSATVSPMDISTPTAAPSSPSNNPLSQQSPSSAFLMAPSPPMFVTSFATTPIPFAAPSSQPPSSSHTQPSHTNPISNPRHSSSPSSPGSHMGHMIQNFVRNISIPHRNRSRTNSSSAVSPPTSTGGNHHHGPASQGSSADVLGKTLVMSSPPPLMLSNHRTGTGHSGFSDLGAVSEQDVEGSGSSAAVGGAGSGSPGSSSSSSSSRSSSHDRGEADHSRPMQTVVTETTA
ncbi:hypothetical protein KI688_009374 [Linnemannia hyalina]|uniref:SMAD/FHA domain-containing protein n=1 Tax=Linnemannia hyalina TaxID=64524 RepID=A0A9P8BV49_9FUNG|nr:hypothetical protein KI688_009374 [Linnemannia hyalina]